MSFHQEIGQPSRLLPRTIEDVLRAWIARLGGLALLFAVAIVWVAMLTWSANDPSLSLNTSEPAQNLLGPFGAATADFFFHTLGLSVVFFVVPPLVLGLQWVLGETVLDVRRRIVLMVVSSVAIAGGLSALPIAAGWSPELGYGGIIGDFAYSLVSSLLGVVSQEAGGPVAGLMLFGFGFWTFSRATCLDRHNILKVPLPHFINPFRRSRGGRDAFEANYPVDTNLDDQSASNVVLRPIGTDSPAWDDETPPAWSPDEPMYAYVAERVETASGPKPSAGFSSKSEVEFSPSLIAKKFAAAPTVDQHNTDECASHEIVLLDDDLEPAPDDLPNVLKRARDEVAEIMPGHSDKRVRPRFSLTSESAREPFLPFVEKSGPAFQADGRARSSHNQRGLEPPGLPTGGARPELSQPDEGGAGRYRRPSYNLLKSSKAARPSADTSPSVLQGRAKMLEDVLADFRIKGEIRDVRPGPVITQFELEPARGTKSSRVISLADDVARSMSAVSARIAVVPGRNAIGIELPNTRRETFGLRELIDSPAFLNNSAKLPLVLGKGIAGEPVMADLARMPHMLVAGTTGSGKSVGVNAMILSLIYRLGPAECRLLLIDPKMLELSVYNGIPHLLTPVITDPQKAVTALTWAVGEMEERYKRMAELGVRSIDAFNARVKQAARTGEKLSRTVQTGFDPTTGEAIYENASLNAEPLPNIVIVVDEFADLMAVAGKEIDGLVQRLAQMARAAGIHLIMATQRPSVDVVTGTIKANFPTRLSYRVASRIDSRTILGEQGAEQLLGQGDMLFMSGAGDVQRVHGPFVSDEEVEAVADHLRRTAPANYSNDVLADHVSSSAADGTKSTDASTDLYDQAVELVLKDQRASTSYLQRRLSIGYNRAADLIDRMETDGVISAAGHAGRRDILKAG